MSAYGLETRNPLDFCNFLLSLFETTVDLRGRVSARHRTRGAEANVENVDTFVGGLVIT